MVQNPPPNSQHIVPYLTYEDPRGAIDFLCNVFGFEQGLIIEGPDGSVGHAEVHRSGETLMLSGEFAEMGLKSPRKLDGLHAQIMLYVEDVDAHHAHAKAAGAQIVQEPEDQFYGDRTYRVVDPEGNSWDIHQHVRDISPEEMAAAAAAMAQG